MSQRINSVVVSPIIENSRISVIRNPKMGRATIVDKRRSTARGSIFKLNIEDRKEVRDQNRIDIFQNDKFSK